MYVQKKPEVRGPLADVAIVTSDNPRSENPLTIIDEIVGGMSASHCESIIEPDRAAAIQRALELARPGDSVLIAGKGHENEQIIDGRHLPFDDRQVSRAFLSERWRPQLGQQRRASA